MFENPITNAFIFGFMLETNLDLFQNFNSNTFNKPVFYLISSLF